MKVTPVGSDPLAERESVGLPVEVTVKLPAVPTVNVVELADVMAGAASTVRVKDWVAGLPTPLEALMLKEKLPLTVGVPDRVAVPLPLSAKPTPAGSVPVSERESVGLPVEVTVKLPALPSVNVVELADVMAGAASTVRVKDWVAGLPTPLVAVMVKGKLPPTEGVPARVAVPLPWSTKVTPAGSVPVSERPALGLPVEVTVKLPALPVVKVVELAEVMAGAASTVRVKD